MLYSVRIGLVAHKMAPWVPDTMDPVLVKHNIFFQRPVLLTSDWWSILNVFELNDFWNYNFFKTFLGKFCNNFFNFKNHFSLLTVQAEINKCQKHFRLICPLEPLLWKCGNSFNCRILPHLQRWLHIFINY